MNYWPTCCPGLTVFGLGLALMVAPLTATVLAAAPDEHAGIASGVNNAVARAGSLLAVAALPVAVGLGGEEYADPSAFDAAYGSAMLICAVLLAPAAWSRGSRSARPCWSTPARSPAAPLVSRLGAMRPVR